MDNWTQLQRLLHRAGELGYYWLLPSKKTVWFPADCPTAVPNAKGKTNIYFGVHPTRAIPPTNAKGLPALPEDVRAQIAYVAAINCLFTEYDVKDWGSKDAIKDRIDSLTHYPTAIIDSGGGYHCYWILKEPFVISDTSKLELAISFQADWVGIVGGDSDSKDLARVLRVPETHNYKAAYAPDYPKVEVVYFAPDDLYDLYALVWEIGQNARATPKKRQEATFTPRTDGVERAAQDWVEEAVKRTGGRNARGVWLAGILRDDGFTQTEAEAAMLNYASRVTGEKKEPYPDKEALKTLDWAYSKSMREKPYQRRAEKSDPYLPADTLESPTLDARDVPAPPPPPIPPPLPEENEEPNFLQFDATDEGNAESVWLVNAGRFAFVTERGWMKFTGTHWEAEGADATLGFAVVDVLRRRRAQAARRNFEAHIKAAKPDAARISACIKLLQKHAHTPMSEFDNADHLLNVANGVIDLRSGELRPHNSISTKFSYCIPTEYDSAATCPEWISFLNEVVENAATVVSWLQEAVGYSLTGETREECLFFLWGKTRSGKGTFTETLARLMQKPLAVEVDFNTFTVQRGNPDAQNFALAPLRPSRVVLASESDKSSRLNEAKLKFLTGGNDVHCAFKGKDHFTYTPRYKIWLSSNNRPNPEAYDDAIWGRIRQVNFPNSHLGREDKRKKERLRSPESLKGILSWAVEGAKRWYAAGDGLVTPKAVQDATNESRAELDSVQQWLDENMQAEEGAWISNSLLQMNYKNWCEENNHLPLGARMLGRALTAKGFTLASKKVNGATARGVEGIAIAGRTVDRSSFFPHQVEARVPIRK